MCTGSLNVFLIWYKDAYHLKEESHKKVEMERRRRIII